MEEKRVLDTVMVTVNSFNAIRLSELPAEYTVQCLVIDVE